jgi:energy-coupling factor transport system ATP-binding protein
LNAIDVRDVFRVHSTPEGDAAALQGLSLAVREREVVTVLGPSGAGKSTLLRLLAGLERPSAGAVRVLGDDLGKLPARRLADYRAANLGYVDQHYVRALAPELSARELVALQLGLRGSPEAMRFARADALLERVGLASKRDRRPRELSGGEQQRVALCAALAHEPRIFLADEPTGELDAETADQVYDLVGELVREQGCTTLLVSHDPESAKVADRIIRIRDGRVSEEWDRGDESPDTIVVGRGGWLRLPEDLLLRAGIGDRASAALDDGRVVVTPAPGTGTRTGTSRVSVLTREDGPATAAATARVTPAGELVVRVRRLAKSYGETRVLDGLDADFSGGRLYAVTGPSGSGKTTFLHLLAGLDLPDAGTVEVDGVELTSLDRAERAAHRRRTIAYVGQQVGLVPHLSAVENVELALTIRGIAESRAEALHALEAVGLAERATQRVARLSQGERARVAIARAVATQPKLLLADEPTSRLDGANAIAVAHLLARLARDTGAAVLCATHDPLVIEQADEQLRVG